MVTLGWSAEPLTLRALAELVGASVARVRYHVEALAALGRLELDRDRLGRVLVEARRDHGTLIRCHDGAVLGPATRDHVERSRRAAARELRPRSGAPEPGLGVICVDGFRVWIEPPVLLAA